MKIGRHGLRDHVRLMQPSFGLVAAVWLLRLIVDAASSPAWVIRLVSVSVASAAALLLSVVLIHFRRFGSYASVVTASLLLGIWSHGLIVLAILFGVVTGTTNIYTAPEFSFPGNDPRHLRHIYAHLTFGVGTWSLGGAAMGCLLLWLLRALVPLEKPAAAGPGGSPESGQKGAENPRF